MTVDTAEGVPVTIKTVVDTALGCPYGMAAEQTILADQSEVDHTINLRLNDTGQDSFFAALDTAIEADDRADDLAKGILACETCLGDPHNVDLRDRACAFALEAVTGGVFVPKDIKEYLESRPSYDGR